ncbi:Leo1-like protein-domain-containing protein [Camillea tinctor]|nr:Leo1-like protein-domain-containing protein [Camillea tinctor]
MSDSDEPIDLPDEGGDDLFGDEDDNETRSNQDGVLSDDDLASEQDAGGRHTRDDRDDRDDDAEAQNQQVKEKRIGDVAMFRHRTPRTKDGALQSLKVPSFLRFMADVYKPDEFEPTEWDKTNLQSDKPKEVVRFQRDEQTGELKSNALVYRWSDGSMTMSVGGEHYEIQKKMMAPPANKPYEEREDAHYYAAAVHFSEQLLITVGHITEQYTVNLNRNMQDEARIKFANDMAAAARGKRPNGADMIITATQDPELQKKEAELAEKERMKAQRRRENAAARLDSTRSGGYRAGGLSIGDLEGRRAGGPRKRGAPGAQKAKRRRPEYDSDDDFPAGTHRQNEYDREDDFIAPSDDEQMSGVDDDDDEEDILDDDDEEEEEAPRKKRQKTADAEDDDADADADADLDDIDAPAVESSRARRRNIIDEDDDE